MGVKRTIVSARPIYTSVELCLTLSLKTDSAPVISGEKLINLIDRQIGLQKDQRKRSSKRIKRKRRKKVVARAKGFKENGRIMTCFEKKAG